MPHHTCHVFCMLLCTEVQREGKRAASPNLRVRVRCHVAAQVVWDMCELPHWDFFSRFDFLKVTQGVDRVGGGL